MSEDKKLLFGGLAMAVLAIVFYKSVKPLYDKLPPTSPGTVEGQTVTIANVTWIWTNGKWVQR